MADLSAIMKQLQLTYAPVNQATVNGINSSYAGQSAADRAVYNNSLSQAKQTLSQVPAQFNGERSGADITKNQAMGLLPANLANSGADTDSGANYAARTNIGNTFQNTMGTIGKSQDAATQAAQNSIDNLNANEAATQAKLNSSKASDLASAYTSAADKILSDSYSQFNAQASREESAAEAANSLAEKQYEYGQNLALKKATAANTAAATANKSQATAKKNYATGVNSLNSTLKNYYANSAKIGNSVTGYSTKYTISDPDAFLTEISSNPYLTTAQKESYINSVSYRTANGLTLRQYINKKVSGGTPKTAATLDPLGLMPSNAKKIFKVR